MRETLESLKFVQGATSETRLDDNLSYFLIKDGYVTGFNGFMQLSSPIDTDIVMAPRAKELVRALEQCLEEVEMKLTPTGNLRLISGDFAAVVPTIDHEELSIQPPPPGRNIVSSPQIFDVLRVMKSFISDDASRTWSTGILFGGGDAYATNNIVVARMPTGMDGDLWFNLPVHVVDEMLRVGDNPNAFTIHDDGKKITVRYPGHRLITSTLGSLEWPNLKNILNGIDLTQATGTPVDGILDGAERVRHFLNPEGVVYISPDGVHTSLDIAGEGAVAKVETGVHQTTGYMLEMIRKLKGNGNMVDLSNYPEPAPFWNSGNGLVGALVGVAI